MRSPRYYLNQVYLIVAINTLERVQCRSQVNRRLMTELIKELKHLRQCI